jgi:hypothetical protein
VMAGLMLKPQVTAFLNVVTSAQEPGINFEEIEVGPTCGAVGKTIGELDVCVHDLRNVRLEAVERVPVRWQEPREDRTAARAPGSPPASRPLR